MSYLNRKHHPNLLGEKSFKFETIDIDKEMDEPPTEVVKTPGVYMTSKVVAVVPI